MSSIDFDAKTGKVIFIDEKNDIIYADEPQPPTTDQILADLVKVADLLVAENVALKTRLAKIEAVPIVKTALEPIIVSK